MADASLNSGGERRVGGERRRPAASAVRLRAAVVLCRGDEILLVEHRKGAHRYWLLPGGGVEWGETLAAAAARELLEETGYQAVVGNLLVVCEGIEPGGRHIINLVFVASHVGGELHPGLDGRVVGAAWHRRDTLRDLQLFPPIADVLLECWEHGFSDPVRVLGNVWRDLPDPT